MLKHPIFLLAGLALAIQSGMEGMSNDWMTRYFKKVTLSGQHADEWKTLLGLMAVTGAMVLARIVLSGLLKHIKSQIVLFASIGITAAGALLLMYATSYGVSLAAALLIGAGLAAAFPVVLELHWRPVSRPIRHRLQHHLLHRPHRQHDHQQVLRPAGANPRHRAIHQSHARLPRRLRHPPLSRRQTTPKPSPGK